MATITCVTENTARTGSRFWGEHGLAFCIETDQGCVMFDTGQTGAVLLHNLALLGKTLHDIDAVVLSHAHDDHTGGLPVVLAQRLGLPLYASPDIECPRYSRKDDRYRYIGMPLSLTALAQLADLRLSADPVEVLPGVWTTGEIHTRPEPEGRSASHFVPDGEGWRPDPYQDDLSMVVETGAGLVVVLGCCHAGLLNTLAHVTRVFGRQPIAVLGGTHLSSAAGMALQYVIDVLQETYPTLRLYPNHCTGLHAYVALAGVLGDNVQPYPAGTTLHFA